MVRLGRRKIGSVGHLLLIKVDVEVVLRLQLPGQLVGQYALLAALPAHDLLLFLFVAHRCDFECKLWN